MAALESVGLAYEIGHLSWAILKTLRNSAQSWWLKAGYKVTASLTTLEFEQQGDQQVAHYVHDRSLVFTRNRTRLPPFVYGTDGSDVIEELIVNDRRVRPNLVNQPGLGKLVEPHENIAYSKGDQARAILLARSTNGFPGEEEQFIKYFSEWVERGTVVIVFPPERKPKDVYLLCQAPHDPPTDWKPARWEKFELRRTTRSRIAFVWESISPRVGYKYAVQWRW